MVVMDDKSQSSIASIGQKSLVELIFWVDIILQTLGNFWDSRFFIGISLHWFVESAKVISKCVDCCSRNLVNNNASTVAICVKQQGCANNDINLKNFTQCGWSSIVANTEVMVYLGSTCWWKTHQGHWWTRYLEAWHIGTKSGDYSTWCKHQLGLTIARCHLRLQINYLASNSIPLGDAFLECEGHKHIKLVENFLIVSWLM